MNVKGNIFFKQIFSELIDILLCLGPVLLVYQFVKLDFTSINYIHLFSFIYLLYGVLSMIIAKVQSIGEIIQKIQLISTKNNKKSSTLFLLKVLLKSMMIFLIADLQTLNPIFIVIIILFIFPIKIETKEHTYYSMLNFGFKTTYVSIK